MAYITKEYLENNIKAYDQYRNLNKEGQANGLATLDANGKLPASQSTQSDWNQSNSSAIDYIKNKPTIPSGVTYGGNSVTSIVQGTNTSMSLSSGALTISATGGGGTVPVATSTTVGGAKVSNGGSKTFDYTWSGTDTSPTTTTGSRSITVYKPRYDNGKYYPVECTTDGTAVFCVPGGNSPWWDNTGSNAITVSMNSGSTGNFCTSTTVTLPSTVNFAEFTYYPMNDAGTDFEGNPVIKPIKKPSGNITFTITSDMKAISKNTSSYVSLKITTTDHTYNIALNFWKDPFMGYYYSVIC